MTRFISVFTIITLVIVGSVSLTGCTSQTVKNPPKPTNIIKSNNETSTSDSTLRSVEMTAQQIAYFDLHQGGPPSFGGSKVVRYAPQEAPHIVPTGTKIQGTSSELSPKDFSVIDSWSGLLKDKRFVFNVYKNNHTGQICVARSYVGSPLVLISLKSQSMVIKNFTGSFVVMGVPGPGGPFYALNLMTGQLISPIVDSQKYAHMTSQMSGCYPCVGATGANYITGLPSKYPFNDQ